MYVIQDIVTFEGFDIIKVGKSRDCILSNIFNSQINCKIKNLNFAIINKGIFPEEFFPDILKRPEFYKQYFIWIKYELLKLQLRN